MSKHEHGRLCGFLLAALLPAITLSAEGPLDRISFKNNGAGLQVFSGDHPIACYVYDDPSIPRPYFCQIKSIAGIQVTRPNPPDPVLNKGNDDHDKLHPGLWLAFGDLGGNDFWRNKARVRHVRFDGPFSEENGCGRFSVVNSYEPSDGQGNPVCQETCQYSFHAIPNGYVIVARSQFLSKSADFAFGDQEEMGFGLRLNTPLTVKFGRGSIGNSDGAVNEAGTWGKRAKWCGASGTVDGRRVSLGIVPAPDNFRPCWFHTRDYGLLVANPFGKKAMTAPDDPAVAADTTLVKKDVPFSLTFAVWVADLPEGSRTELSIPAAKCLEFLEHK